MRVISRKAIRLFWEEPKRAKDAKPLLTAWYKVVLAAEWHNFADLRQAFNSADRVGNCTVDDLAELLRRHSVTIHTFGIDPTDALLVLT